MPSCERVEETFKMGSLTPKWIKDEGIEAVEEAFKIGSLTQKYN